MREPMSSICDIENYSELKNQETLYDWNKSGI